MPEQNYPPQGTPQTGQNPSYKQPVQQQIKPVAPLNPQNKHSKLAIAVMGVVIIFAIIAGVLMFLQEDELEAPVLEESIESFEEDAYFAELNAMSDEEFEEFIAQDSADEIILEIDDAEFDKVVNELVVEIGLSEEEARTFAVGVAIAGVRYAEYDEADTASLVTLDLVDYKTKIQNTDEFVLPSEYIKQLTPTPDIIEVQVPNSTDIIDEFATSLETLVPDENERKYLLGEITPFNIPKNIWINLSRFSHYGYVNIEEDLIVYGTDGNIIPALSRANISAIVEEHLSPAEVESLASLNFISIPSIYPDGRFVAEYTIRDKIAKTTTVYRYPMDMARIFTLTEAFAFDFQKLTDGTLEKKTDSNYASDDTILVNIWVTGFKSDVPASSGQVYSDVRVSDLEGNELLSLPKHLIFEDAIDSTGFVEFNIFVELDNALAAGDYILEADIIDDYNGESLTFSTGFSVI